MGKDYKTELRSEYKNNSALELNWYVLVKFNNGDILKIPYGFGPDKPHDFTCVDTQIRKYRLNKRMKKINKIRCKIS